jgi:phosphate/sulfate permease
MAHGKAIFVFFPVALLAIYNTGSVERQGITPLWMMFYGVVGTCFGFWALGHRGF